MKIRILKLKKYKLYLPILNVLKISNIKYLNKSMKIFTYKF